MTANEERLIWKGPSSQALNFWTYAACALTCPLVIPIFIALWRWLNLRARVYEVTTERLRITTGLFGKTTEELELYRVKDGTIVEPFLLRLFGAAHLVLTTSDRTTPTVTLEGVPGARALWDEIRRNVESLRDRKGLRDVDVTEIRA